MKKNCSGVTFCCLLKPFFILRFCILKKVLDEKTKYFIIYKMVLCKWNVILSNDFLRFKKKLWLFNFFKRLNTALSWKFKELVASHQGLQNVCKYIS